MNTAIKTLTFFIAVALLFTAACRNASDDTDPGIFDLRVDGIIDQTGQGEHQLGTIAKFEMDLSDNKGLAEFQVDVQGMLDYTENLDGTTAGVTYDFTVDANAYDIGDMVQIVFIAEDDFGNITLKPYFMTIVE